MILSMILIAFITIVLIELAERRAEEIRREKWMKEHKEGIDALNELLLRHEYQCNKIINRTNENF